MGMFVSMDGSVLEISISWAIYSMVSFGYMESTSDEQHRWEGDRGAIVNKGVEKVRTVLESHCSERQVSYPDTKDANDCAEDAERNGDRCIGRY
jgi:hypothetical protein